MNFVILNCSFEFHTVLCDFDKQKFFILMFLDLMRSIMCFCFQIVKKSVELNFSVRYMAFWSAMRVFVIHCVVRYRLDTNHKREATSRSAHILLKLFHVVNRTLTKSCLLLHGMISVRFLVSISTHSCAWR